MIVGFAVTAEFAVIVGFAVTVRFAVIVKFEIAEFEIVESEIVGFWSARKEVETFMIAVVKIDHIGSAKFEVAFGNFESLTFELEEFEIDRREDRILIVHIFVVDLHKINIYFGKDLFLRIEYSLQAHHKEHLTSEEHSLLLPRESFC